MAKKKTAKAKTLNFSNVKERQYNAKHLPEGDYPALVKSVEVDESENGNEMWVYTMEITRGKGKGASYPERCVIVDKALWRLRRLFAAAGINIPKKKVNVDPNKVVGHEVGITLEDDEYDGKMRSVIAAVIPLSEVGDAPEDAGDSDEEVKSSKKAKAGKKSKKGKKSKNKGLEEIEVEDI